jgi:hypothetical protein
LALRYVAGNHILGAGHDTQIAVGALLEILTAVCNIGTAIRSGLLLGFMMFTRSSRASLRPRYDAAPTRALPPRRSDPIRSRCV